MRQHDGDACPGHLFRGGEGHDGGGMFDDGWNGKDELITIFRWHENGGWVIGK